MHKLVLEHDLVNGWICKHCKSYNDILTVDCVICNVYRDIEYSLFPLETSAAIRRGILIHYENTLRGGDTTSMTNEKRAELHSLFYTNPEKVDFIQKSDYNALVEWEDTLEAIIIEAKAYTQRSQHERRERKAKMSEAERSKLISRPDMTVTEGLTGPRERKARMSNMEKLVETYKSLGMSEEEIKAAMSVIKVDPEKETTLPQPVLDGNSNKFVFNGSPTPLDDDGKIDEKAIKDKEKRDAIKEHRDIEIPKDIPIVTEPQPFDPSKLFG